eukprot:GHVN01032752.1.p1 GENE.GHVN01032752.1~~GHVN01032752.1.p1  ORF type:complete len:218 (-),score=46.75 GHVN01032752.1:110-763(-)
MGQVVTSAAVAINRKLSTTNRKLSTASHKTQSTSSTIGDDDESSGFDRFNSEGFSCGYGSGLKGDIYDDEQDGGLMHFIRPPQLKPGANIGDDIHNEWKYLAVDAERAILTDTRKGRKAPDSGVAEKLGKDFDMAEFSSFVPRIILEGIVDKQITFSTEFDIHIDSFSAALAFVDASGFTALSAALDNQAGGSERLGECINNFFTPLIQIITFWGGE